MIYSCSNSTSFSVAEGKSVDSSGLFLLHFIASDVASQPEREPHCRGPRRPSEVREGEQRGECLLQQISQSFWAPQNRKCWRLGDYIASN